MLLERVFPLLGCLSSRVSGNQHFAWLWHFFCCFIFVCVAAPIRFNIILSGNCFSSFHVFIFSYYARHFLECLIVPNLLLQFILLLASDFMHFTLWSCLWFLFPDFNTMTPTLLQTMYYWQKYRVFSIILLLIERN